MHTGLNTGILKHQCNMHKKNGLFLDRFSQKTKFHINNSSKYRIISQKPFSSFKVTLKKGSFVSV